MSNRLHNTSGRCLSRAAVVVPRQAQARAALAAAEQVVALRRFKRHLYAGMTLTDVRNAIDEHIADIEATLSSRASA